MGLVEEQKEHARLARNALTQADSLLNAKAGTSVGFNQNITDHAAINNLYQSAQAHIAFAAYLKSL